MTVSLPRITTILFLAWMAEMDQRERRKQPHVSIDLDVFTPDGRRACQFYPGVR